MMKKYLLILALISLLVVFFGFTNPNSMPVGLIVLPVIVIFIIFSLVFYVALSGFMLKTDKTRLKYISTFLGLFISIGVLFYSTGGVNVWDALLLGLIFIIGTIYISKI